MVRAQTQQQQQVCIGGGCMGTEDARAARPGLLSAITRALCHRAQPGLPSPHDEPIHGQSTTTKTDWLVIECPPPLHRRAVSAAPAVERRQELFWLLLRPARK